MEIPSNGGLGNQISLNQLDHLPLEVVIKTYLFSRSDALESYIRSRIKGMELNRAKLEDLSTQLNTLTTKKSQIKDPTNNDDVYTDSQFLSSEKPLKIGGAELQPVKNSDGTEQVVKGLYVYNITEEFAEEQKITAQVVDRKYDAQISVIKQTLDQAVSISQRDQTELDQLITKFNQNSTLVSNIVKLNSDTLSSIIHNMN
jgi:hypothetical protein